MRAFRIRQFEKVAARVLRYAGRVFVVQDIDGVRCIWIS